MPTLGSGTNQIVPFATGVGANVETPTNWIADLVRQQGFQNGVANPTQANTVLRQASFIASMIGQFTADYSGATTGDDGNVTNAETNFIAALAAAMQPFGVYFLTDTGAGGANQMIATTATNIPSSYSQVRLLVIKKNTGANTGAMQVNYWGLGLVQLNDNTGTALAGGIVLGNSYYLQTFDGGAFRQLGQVTQTAGAGGVAANSGDAISVIVPSSTVTLTIATPGVVNWTAHGLAANTAIQFTTTGALPTGLSPFVTYYVLSPLTNSFNVAATPGGSAIAFSGTQSGTQTSSAIGAATVNFRVFLGTHDIVVNNGDGWPRAKASDGTARYMLTTEFITWINSIVSSGGITNVQAFTSSGTYTPTGGARKAIVIATGGGGAGGIHVCCAGGGGAGATAIALIASLSGTYSVTIGAGGVGTLASPSGSSIGGNGGNTIVGSVSTAGGGQGCQGIDKGGAGGSASVGLALISGGDGISSTTGNVTGSGNGGASFWGSGGSGASFNLNQPGGYPGNAYGSGGGGGDSGFGSSSSMIGGSGASGFVLILEF